MLVHICSNWIFWKTALLNNYLTEYNVITADMNNGQNHW